MLKVESEILITIYSILIRYINKLRNILTYPVVISKQVIVDNKPIYPSGFLLLPKRPVIGIKSSKITVDKYIVNTVGNIRLDI